MTDYTIDPIAIIGIGCRFPGGANSHKAFWRLLTRGKDAIVDVPAERWDSRRFYDPDPDKPGKVYVNQAGFLKEKIYDFDPLFFGISPREAESMDPQQRLLLEVTWEAFEDAGLVAEQLYGSRTGVFVGGFTLDNLLIRLDETNRELANSHTGASCTMTILSNRISHVFNLHGPSVTMDTACSSSLVATHYACQSLWAKESDLAIVGGVNVILGPEYSLVLSKGRFLSDHGRCMAFDERAAGYTRGEGAGVAILKPLSSALRDKDNIHALLRMSGVNQDGHTPGISMPNADAQESLIREVYQRAGVEPSQIGYVEAHGTGTQAGDPKEIHALHSVLSENRTEQQECLVGSVKTNIGHLEAGAGVAGLIKATMCLKHNKIPPNLHFEKPNPAIPFDEMTLRVPTKLEDWPANAEIHYAGVNSFGYGGTNAHVLLQQAPAPEDPGSVGPWDAPYFLPLSARSEGALRELAGKYAFFLTSENTDRTLADFLHTLCYRRSHHNHRLTLIANDQDELKEKLQLFSSGDYVEHQSMGIAQLDDKPALVFIYTGMGPQWWAMGRELMESDTDFLNDLKECDVLLQKEAGWSIYAALTEDETSSRITRTEIAQPANFVIQVALTRLWERRGIQADAIIGHSVGEVAAAYACGALTLEDAIKVSVHRSRLQASTAGKGTMLAVGLAEVEAFAAIKEYDKLAIGAINSPSGVTLSGDPGQLKRIASKLEDKQIFNRFLDVEVAYHSPQMDVIKHELLESLAGIRPGPAHTPMYSTVTGQQLQGEGLDANYWWTNVRESVRFADGIQTLLQAGFANFLEVGPHPVLAHSVKEIAALDNKKVNLVCSLNRKFPERIRMLESLGELYCLGYPVNWQSVIPEQGRFIPVPGYPWQKERYWSESEQSRQHRFGQTGNVFLNTRLPLPHPTWTVELNSQFFPFLPDHKVSDEIVFPGMAYVDAGLAVHQACLDEDISVLSEVELTSMLFVEPQQVQMLSVDYDEAAKRFSIHSRYKQDGADWKQHAHCKLIEGAYDNKPEPISLQALKDGFDRQIDTGTMYEELQTRGLSYGPSFQCAKQLWIKDDEILLQIEAKIDSPARGDQHLLYPPLTDTALQSILSIVPGSAPYVPVSIDKVIVYQSPGLACWCHGVVNRREQNRFDASYTFFDEQGNILTEFRQVAHQEVLSASSRSSDLLHHSLYEPKWLIHDSKPQEKHADIQDCLLFAHDSALQNEIIKELTRRNLSYSNVYLIDDTQQPDPGPFVMQGDSKADFDALMTQLSDKTLTHVFYLWPLALDSKVNFDDMLGVTTQLTYLVQAINEASDNKLELTIVTQSAQQVIDADTARNLNLSPLWGLGQLIQNEHPNIHCRMLDISSESPVTDIENWFAYLAFDPSNDLAFRGNDVYVKRLTQFLAEQKSMASATRQLSTGEVASLQILQPGNLDSLSHVKADKQPPDPGQVEIEVHYSALNFKDILKAYGTIARQTIEGTYFGAELGMELSGTISRIGPDVTGFSIGDEVVTAVGGSFRSFVTVPSTYVIKKPDNIGLDTFFIHIGYLTAYYGLKKVADLRPGETVLIHNASGGLGLAAIQVAKLLGAEIFATAGTEEKRQYLRTLGIQHVMNSRTLSFADEVHLHTQGEGIDVVLNALSGDALRTSFSLLKPYGRFIEVGKKDISENTELPMSTFNRNITFSAVDIDRMHAERPDIVVPLLNEISMHFSQGDFSALPTQVFEASEVQEAFRCLAQGKHIGKLAVRYHNQQLDVIDAEHTRQYKPKGAYLITGGTSGFGLELAKWLADKGIEKLVLMSRSGASSDDAKAAVEVIRDKGIDVDCPKIDISQADQVTQIIMRLQQNGTKVRGIFHGAMVLDDGFLVDMDEDRYRAVMLPKVKGTLNLYECCKDLDLDYFVLFSSVASLVGNRGQANYIAANTFLDEFSQMARREGFPAITINWGVLAETGVAARNAEVSRLLAQEGVSGLSNQQALSALDYLLTLDKPQIGVLQVDWQRWKAANSSREQLSRFHTLFAAGSQQDGAANAKSKQIAEELFALSEEERYQYIESILQQSVAKVLKLTPNKIDVSQDVGKLGIDSLMFLELTLVIQDSLGLDITTMELMKEPVISILAKTILNKLSVLHADTNTQTQLPN